MAESSKEWQKLARIMENDQNRLAFDAYAELAPRYTRTGNPNDWDEVAQVAERGRKAAILLQNTEAAGKYATVKEKAEQFSSQHRVSGGILTHNMDKQLLAAEKEISEWEKVIANRK